MLRKLRLPDVGIKWEIITLDERKGKGQVQTSKGDAVHTAW